MFTSSIYKDFSFIINASASALVSRQDTDTITELVSLLVVLDPKETISRQQQIVSETGYLSSKELSQITSLILFQLLLLTIYCSHFLKNYCYVSIEMGVGCLLYPFFHLRYQTSIYAIRLLLILLDYSLCCQTTITTL